MSALGADLKDNVWKHKQNWLRLDFFQFLRSSQRERQLLLENQGEWNFVTLNKISSQCHICPDVGRTADSSWRNLTHATVAQMPSLRLLHGLPLATRRAAHGDRFTVRAPASSALCSRQRRLLVGSASALAAEIYRHVSQQAEAGKTLWRSLKTLCNSAAQHYLPQV